MSAASASPPSSRSSSLSSQSGPRTPPNMHQNTIDPAATWLVQKYGGTSVGKFAAQIAENIIPYVAAILRLTRCMTQPSMSIENTLTNTRS